ncbi:hypothetical protein MRQ36_28000 [Micromonospora sp. R77]|uniref:hypothetical protein n=1 Tax=Micromonospora sp. R77 TaxID=2925836 RepID=UPI001F617264|nr:hypothetical protein [Micromonospora sp. R77]MCI4066185.1 hypothetical protein [Micromonospora sp. R77]
MLSFTTVHTIADCVVTAHAEAALTGWGTPPTLLLLVHRRRSEATPGEVVVVEFPLHPNDVLTDPARLPALLYRLAHGLQPSGGRLSAPYQATLRTILRRVRGTGPAVTVLAWAALYDIHTLDGAPRPVRRVDAVDVDGRAYTLTDVHGEGRPLLAVDDAPRVEDMPATLSGLAALLAITAGVAHIDTGEDAS